MGAEDGAGAAGRHGNRAFATTTARPAAAMASLSPPPWVGLGNAIASKPAPRPDDIAIDGLVTMQRIGPSTTKAAPKAADVTNPKAKNPPKSQVTVKAAGRKRHADADATPPRVYYRPATHQAVLQAGQRLAAQNGLQTRVPISMPSLRPCTISIGFSG